MRVFRTIARVVRRRPWTVIAVALVLTVALGLGLLFLDGDISYQSLLPGDFPSKKALQSLNRDFQGIAYETVLLKAPPGKVVTDSRIVELMLGIGDDLKGDSDFNEGQIATDDRGDLVALDYLDNFAARIKSEMKARGYDVPLSAVKNDMFEQFSGMSYREAVETQLLPNPLVQKNYVGKFVSPDKKFALIKLKVGAGLSDGQQVRLANDLERFFRTRLRGTGLTFEIAGDATLARDFARHMKNKTILLLLLALAFVVLMLFLAFRRFSDTVLPVAVMLTALLWTFGLTGWIGVHYSVAAIVIMPLLLGTALTFVVPFVARYYEEMEHHFRSVLSVGIAVTTVGVGILLAAITNVFGFLVFKFSVLPPLRDFGLTCAIGTAISFLLAVFLLPAVMVVRDRHYEKEGEEAKEKLKTHFDGLSRRKKRGPFARGTDRALGAFTVLSTRHSIVVIAVFTVLTLAGFIQIRGLTTDSDLRKLIPGDLPGIKADFEIEKIFGGQQQQDVIMVKGDVLDPGSLAVMSRLEETILNDPRNTRKAAPFYTRKGARSLSGALQDSNDGRLPATPEEVRRAIRTAVENGGYIRGLLGQGDRSALIALDARASESTREVDERMAILTENSRDLLEPEGLTFELGGITAITKDMTRNIIPTETLASILSLVLCGLILMIIFRSVPYGLITLTVAFAGVAAEIGFLELMNWPIDPITSLVSALVIGIGVNFGILFTHRYMQEAARGDCLPSEAVKNTMINLGRANVVAALSTVAAFVIIMFSAIVPLKRFGGVTAFAIGWCLIASLTLMPALLFRLSSHREMHQEEQMPEPLPGSP